MRCERAGVDGRGVQEIVRVCTVSTTPRSAGVCGCAMMFQKGKRLRARFGQFVQGGVHCFVGLHNGAARYPVQCRVCSAPSPFVGHTPHAQSDKEREQRQVSSTRGIGGLTESERNTFFRRTGPQRGS